MAHPAEDMELARVFKDKKVMTAADLRRLGYEPGSEHAASLFDLAEAFVAGRKYREALSFYEELEQLGPAFQPQVLVWARLLQCHAGGGVDGFHEPPPGTDLACVVYYARLVIAEDVCYVGLAHQQLAIVLHLHHQNTKALEHLRAANACGCGRRPAHQALYAHLLLQEAGGVEGNSVAARDMFEAAFTAAGVGLTEDSVSTALTVCTHEVVYMCWLFYETLVLTGAPLLSCGHPQRALQWHWLKKSSDCAVVYLCDYYMHTMQSGAFHTLAVQHLLANGPPATCQPSDPRGLILGNFRWFYQRGYALHVPRACHGPRCNRTTSCAAGFTGLTLLAARMEPEEVVRRIVKKAALRACAHCPRVYYCSIECQKEHWAAGHREVCGHSQTILAWPL